MSVSAWKVTSADDSRLRGEVEPARPVGAGGGSAAVRPSATSATVDSRVALDVEQRVDERVGVPEHERRPRPAPTPRRRGCARATCPHPRTCAGRRARGSARRCARTCSSSPARRAPRRPRAPARWPRRARPGSRPCAPGAGCGRWRSSGRRPPGGRRGRRRRSTARGGRARPCRPPCGSGASRPSGVVQVRSSEPLVSRPSLPSRALSGTHARRRRPRSRRSPRASAPRCPAAHAAARSAAATRRPCTAAA